MRSKMLSPRSTVHSRPYPLDATVHLPTDSLNRLAYRSARLIERQTLPLVCNQLRPNQVG